MARKLRVEYEGAIYHVMNRGDRREPIFQDDKDRECLMATLGEVCAKTGWQVLALCLMPNHFHLLIKLLAYSGMTELMQKVLTAYSMYFNKRYKRVGHLFQGVYKAVLVDKEDYLLYVTRYIHENPLELSGMTRSDLVNYPYSSYAYYLKEKHADWVKTDYILDFFNEKQTYKEFVEDAKLNSVNALGPKLIID